MRLLSVLTLFAIVTSGCSMGRYQKVASECYTKSGVYKNSPKKECYCQEQQKVCPCETKDGVKLHAYKRD